MLTLLGLVVLAVGGLFVLIAGLALLKLVLLLVLLPLRLGLRLVLLPLRLVLAVVLLPVMLLMAAVGGIGVLAASIPLLPLALVVLLVWLMMRRAPSPSAPRPL